MAAGALVVVAYCSFAMWFSRRRSVRLGWADGPTQFLVRTNVVDEQLSLLRKDKLQTLKLRQTFFQRRLGLGSLSLITAGRGVGGIVTIPDLPLATAQELLHRLGHHAAATLPADII